MSDVKRRFWANAKMNNDFICIITYSGYRATCADYKGAEYILPPDVDDAKLGEAIIDALSKSRFVLSEPREGFFILPEVEFDKTLYDLGRLKESYEEWIKNMMKRFHYKTRRALFKDMRNCSIEKSDGVISIEPSRHEKLEGWSGDGISEDDHVVVADSASPNEIGAALRLAFSRCI